MKSKSLQVFCVLALFTAGLSTMVPAADNPASLSAADIIKQARAKYASLNSYSDEGTAVSTLGATTAASYNFTVKLARTNLYQVVWRKSDDLFMPKGVVWSAGSGNFLWMGKGFKPQQQKDMELALASATGISGGVAANIPGTFFNARWGGQLGATTAAAIRGADMKIGEVDCYVLTHNEAGRTNILWIGKQDFLIHQVENDTSGATLRAMMEEQAKKNPQIRAMLDASGSQLSHDVISIETHQNIVINPPLNRADFDFQVPAAPKP